MKNSRAPVVICVFCAVLAVLAMVVCRFVMAPKTLKADDPGFGCDGARLSAAEVSRFCGPGPGPCTHFCFDTNEPTRSPNGQTMLPTSITFIQPRESKGSRVLRTIEISSNSRFVGMFYRPKPGQAPWDMISVRFNYPNP